MLSLYFDDWLYILANCSVVEIIEVKRETETEYGLIEIKYKGKYRSLLFDKGMIYYDE